MNRQSFEELRAVLPSVSRETFDDLVSYQNYVKKWQPHINLIANTTIPYIWERHILDSVQLFPLAPKATQWLDIGSGGGFPGIVLGIMLKEQNGGKIDLVESNGKKCSFLRTVSANLELPVTVHQNRIEMSYDLVAKPEVITARALASLDQLFSLIQPWFSDTTVALLQKGRDYAREVDEAHARWQFNLVQHTSVVDEDSVILEISNLHSGI